MAVVDRWPLVEVWLYQEPLALTKHCNEGDPLRRNTPAKGVKKLQTPITWKKIQLIWSHNRSGLLSSETCNQRCPRYQNIDPTKCLRNQLGMVGPFSCVIIIVIIIISCCCHGCCCCYLLLAKSFELLSNQNSRAQFTLEGDGLRSWQNCVGGTKFLIRRPTNIRSLGTSKLWEGKLTIVSAKLPSDVIREF